MTARNIITSKDVQPILDEITTFTLYGLSVDADDWKGAALKRQWYLERILLSLGISLTKTRDELLCIEGINPEEPAAFDLIDRFKKDWQ